MGARRNPDFAPPVEGPRPVCPASTSADTGPAARLLVRQRSLVFGPADGWLYGPLAPDRRRRRPASPPADPGAHWADPGRAARLLDQRGAAGTLGVATGRTVQLGRCLESARDLVRAELGRYAGRRARAVERSGGLPAHARSEEHTSELQSPYDLVCRLLLEKKKTKIQIYI